MKTREIFCVCLVLTPFIGILDGGLAGVFFLWLFFAYKAYMNHLLKIERDEYIFMRDNISFQEERKYHEYYADKVNKGEEPVSMLEWFYTDNR